MSIAQLRAAGLTRGRIEHRLRTGHLHALHRGVYAVGHDALAPLAREVAALLACGPTAVLSHRSAAALARLLPWPSFVEVSITTRSVRAHEGIRVHRPTTLETTEVLWRDGLPFTAPARTVLDLASELSAPDLERLVAEAQVQRLLRPDDLRGRGSKKLDALLDEGPRLTRSEAERRLLGLVRRAGLPTPRTNQRVGTYEVDLLWPGAGVAVEVDGYAFHGHRRAWERDHRRDLALQAAGLRTIRVTWRQIVDEPEAVIAALARALAG